ncbi:MAG: hypothetical protein M1280_02200 [Actinobacteria bacterium]|nr:hypothetical protein [Actinomycetota bacterium]
MAVSISGPGTRQATGSSDGAKGQAVDEENPKSKKKLLIIVIVAVLLLAIGYLGVTKVIMKPVPHYGPNNPPRQYHNLFAPKRNSQLGRW